MRQNKLQFIIDAANAYECPISRAVKASASISGNISPMELVKNLEAEGFVVQFKDQEGDAYKGCVILAGTSGCANPANSMNMPKGTVVPEDIPVAIGWVDTHEEALLYAILGYFRECLIESRDRDHLTIPDSLKKWDGNAIKPVGESGPVTESVTVKPTK